MWRRWSKVWTVFWISLLALALMTCSSSTGNGNAGGGPSPTPTSTTGPGPVHGCPNESVVRNAPVPANVVITLNDTDRTIVAHVGNIIEVNLPFGRRWSGPTWTQGAFALQQPAGYAWECLYLAFGGEGPWNGTNGLL